MQADAAPDPAAVAAPDVGATPMPGQVAAAAEPPIAASAKLVELEEGLFAVSIRESGGAPGEVSGIVLPAFHVTAPPSERFDPVDILMASGEWDSWLGRQGGVAVVRSPPGGGQILVTSFGVGGDAAPDAQVEIRRVDDPATPRVNGQSRAPRAVARPATAGLEPSAARRESASARPEPAPGRFEPIPSGPETAPLPRLQATAARELRTEVALHMERLGDRRYPGQGWVGNRGQRLRIEAFSIRPLDVLSPSDIEYKAFGPDGRETPWVSDGRLCGTRGRGLPLTGFALRLAAPMRDRFDVVYQGSFFDSGIIGPSRNGEPCVPTIPDDPLEAINLRLVERPGS